MAPPRAPLRVRGGGLLGAWRAAQRAAAALALGRVSRLIDWWLFNWCWRLYDGGSVRNPQPLVLVQPRRPLPHQSCVPCPPGVCVTGPCDGAGTGTNPAQQRVPVPNRKNIRGRFDGSRVSRSRSQAFIREQGFVSHAAAGSPVSILPKAALLTHSPVPRDLIESPKHTGFLSPSASLFCCL